MTLRPFNLYSHWQTQMLSQKHCVLDMVKSRHTQFHFSPLFGHCMLLYVALTVGVSIVRVYLLGLFSVKRAKRKRKKTDCLCQCQSAFSLSSYDYVCVCCLDTHCYVKGMTCNLYSVVSCGNLPAFSILKQFVL